MAADRRISVSVPCFNRAWYLNRFLHSLTWSQVPLDQFEVIVANDGSSDHVNLIVDAWRRRGMDVTAVEVRRFGMLRGSAVARNVGARSAKYPIVLGTDPEMIFASDVLKLLSERMAEGAYCTAGQFYQMTREAQLRIELDGNWGGLTGADYIAMTDTRPNLVDSPDNCRAFGAAFGCWRDVLHKIRGYDESFTEWGWEDEDMLVRLEQGLGLERVFVHEAIVVHQWHPLLRSREGDTLELAREGHLSELSWRVHLQQARAQNLVAVVKNSPDWGMPDGRTPPRTRFQPGVYSLLISEHERRQFQFAWRLAVAGDLEKARSAMPQNLRNIFEAHYREAVFLKTNKLLKPARKLLLYALSRPWEGPESDWTWEGWTPPLIEELRLTIKPANAIYPLVPETLVELAAVEFELDNPFAADSALQVLEAELGTHHLAYFYRARRAAQAGDWREAAELMSEALKLEPRAQYYSMAIDLALRQGDRKKAYGLVVEALGRRQAYNSFDLLQLHGYLESLRREAEEEYPIPEDLAEHHARFLEEKSEFLYSVAIRSIRAGYDSVAIVLLQKFLAGKAQAELRLYHEGVYHLASALKRRGHVEQAREQFDLIIKKNFLRRFTRQMSAAVHFHIGELLLREGKNANALKRFKRCLLLDAQHRRAAQHIKALGG